MVERTEEAREGVESRRWRRWRIRPATYRRLTLLAALALAVIIVTGALVRLTGSGLGCPDWPECNRSSFVDVSSTHRAIEG
jgi:cytochrome c oxidase assembly protein subunit 15